VSNGFGYFRINTDYADDDSFDLDLRIERIANPFSVYGDPLSKGSDSADWEPVFCHRRCWGMTRFAPSKRRAGVNWAGSGYTDWRRPVAQDKSVLVAEWCARAGKSGLIVALSDGSVLEASVYAHESVLDAQGVTVLGERTALSHKVTQTVLTGAEVRRKID